MLDHDELVPEEQAYPDFVQELLATYRMKPEEKQVLARVHTRLAQSSHPLPIRDPVPAGGYTWSPRTAPSVSPPPSRSTRARQRGLQRLNALVAVLFVGLLVGSLVFLFSTINRTRVGSPTTTVGVTNAISVVLVPAEKGRAPSQAEMKAARTILSQRFISFGLNGSSVRVLTVNGQPRIVVGLPHFGGNESQTIATLLETGVLAFWDTGPGGAVMPGTPFNPDQYTQYNPGGQPRFTNQDLSSNDFAVMRDPYTSMPMINFMMKGDAVKRFQLYTANNIGHFLTITLDGKVLASEAINSAISGPFDVAPGTQQQASAVVSILKYGPLPVKLKKLA